MTRENDKTRNRISGALIQLRAKAPFFGVLAMHADYVADRSVPTAATDGRSIYYNPEYFSQLTGPQLTGIILHEVLHCAYLHITRRGRRGLLRWNIAADYVVNSMVPEVEGAKLPEGLLVSTKYKGRKVEEVYDMLPLDLGALGFGRQWLDIRARQPAIGPEGQTGGTQQCDEQPEDQQGGGARPGDEPIHSTGLSEETYWRHVINSAVQAHKASNARGRLPLGAELLVNAVSEPQVSWRDLLRDYTMHHPFNYGEYDLRLVGRGIYEEQLEGERLELAVCLDTSGSCRGWVPQFMGEFRGMLSAFPHVNASLYYADATLHGPYEVERYEEAPWPKGGGGTDFQPFFQQVRQDPGRHVQRVLVYLTDGNGRFPTTVPEQETVWVVTPGGRQDHAFPFGRVIRLGTDR